MKRQSELVRSLRVQLAATEKELADQKWLHEQFLNSFSWRWTAPVRWAVNQLRKVTNGHHVASPPPFPEKPEAGEESNGHKLDASQEAKVLFTSMCHLSLENFLESGATLELPQSPAPVVSIILVLFNRAELTLACLRSIAENHNEQIEVVIVDNASSDQTPQLLERLRGPRIITNSANRHFLEGANQGARECRGEYILLLNNDAQLLPGALQSALRTIRSSPDIGAAGGKIILLDGSLQEAGSVVWQDGSCTGYGRGDDPFAPMYSFRRDVDYCSGAFLLTPRIIWEQLGGFDRSYEPAYYEETDYCMRLWERGLRVVYEPDAAILHYEFASSRSTAAAINLQARNQKIFADRHGAVLAKRDKPGLDELLRARARNAEHRILFIDDRVPHLWLGSGFPRAHTLHRALRKLGYFVTLYPTAVIDEPWDQIYSDFPREIEVMTDMGKPLLESFLRSRKGYYSAIIVSRPHNMKWIAPYLKEHPDWFKNVKVIYDAEALYTEREIGLRKLSGKPMIESEIDAALDDEVRLTSLANRVITVSEKDRNAFLIHGIKDVWILGHSLEPTPGVMPFESREGFLFVGAVHEDTSPNADSLIWFLTQIYPRIRKSLGDVPVTIAGINQSERIREMAIPPIRITGQLPSLEELYDTARVFIAPTRYAAGIPHKVHEAAARGLPVVATPLLAEQLGWTNEELAIAGDPEGFAEQCVAAYTDARKWSTLREAALARVQQECSPAAFEEGVRRLLGQGVDQDLVYSPLQQRTSIKTR